MKKLRKTNPNLIELIKRLKKCSAEHSAPIWKDVAERLERPLRNWAEVNIAKLERIASDGETVLIPGKLLGGGSLTKKLTVSAFAHSEQAAKKIHASGGRFVPLLELVAHNPKGTKIRIIK